MNLKKKIYLYANYTTQRCPKEVMKIFLIEDFFHFPPVSMTPVVHLKLREFFAKIRNGHNGIIRGLGKLIYEKNKKKKICPFKPLNLNTEVRTFTVALEVFMSTCDRSDPRTVAPFISKICIANFDWCSDF
jgi:hypothetical protein